MAKLLRVIAALLFPVWATPQAVDRTKDVTIHAGTQEVLLDFVARDKHQRAIKDLGADEVRVYEDGVLQQPNSFRYRDGTDTTRATTAVTTASHSNAGYDPLRELNVVSIVFESMSADTRRRATEYADEFLNSGIGPNTYIGVFTLNHQVSVVQPYTSDLALVRQGIRRAGTGTYRQFAKESSDRIAQLNSLLAMQSPGTFQPLDPGSAAERGPAGGLGTAAVAVLLQIEDNALKNLYQQSGARNIDALRSLIRAQQLLPGRKTVFYISEGLVVPPDQPELLHGLIGEANRANVTFYTLDARGLRVTSGMRESIMATEAINATQDSGPAVQQTDIQANARELAQGTGGFAMDNSNDLRAPLHRIMEDVQAHYEVAYTPTSSNLDGRFRTVEVKILRKGITLQSRKGYFALPMEHGEVLSMVEVAALKALNANPPPKAFDFETAAFDLGSGLATHQYSIAFSESAKAARFKEDAAKKSFAIHIAAMALVKSESAANGENGTVVARMFRDLPYQAALTHRAEFENGAITITMPLALPPGRYRVETAMVDLEATTASTRAFALVVPPPVANKSKLELSDFVWVRSVRASEPADTRNPADPLDTPMGQITPELTATFRTGITPGIYFKVYSSAGAASLSARVSISKDGVPTQAMQLTLPAADSDGSISFLGELPVDKLPAGDYDVELRVRSEADVISRLARLTLRNPVACSLLKRLRP